MDKCNWVHEHRGELGMASSCSDGHWGSRERSLLTSSAGEQKGCLGLVCPSLPGVGSLQTYCPTALAHLMWVLAGVPKSLRLTSYKGWHIVGVPIQSLMAPYMCWIRNVAVSLYS